MSEPALRLEGRSYEQLQELRLELESDIQSIRRQIERAQAEARATGKYASHHWWLKVHQALRIKGHQCQEIQQEMGRFTRSRKEARSREVELRFVEAARKKLPPDVFRSLMEEALKVA